MSEKDDPVFVVQDISMTQCCGITKRELFAAMAMQGLARELYANDWGEGVNIFESITEKSVVMADALIEALNAKE
jgi:hypothetical protein